MLAQIHAAKGCVVLEVDVVVLLVYMYYRHARPSLRHKGDELPILALEFL